MGELKRWGVGGVGVRSLESWPWIGRDGDDRTQSEREERKCGSRERIERGEDWKTGIRLTIMGGWMDEWRDKKKGLGFTNGWRCCWCWLKRRVERRRRYIQKIKGEQDSGSGDDRVREARQKVAC